MSGCGAVKVQNSKNLIVTSLYPIYIFALNVADGVACVEVRCMAEQNTGCLHDYSLTAGDTKLISDCDVFVINGAGMEGFLEDIEGLSQGTRIIDSSEGIPLICAHHTEEEEHEGNGHNHAHVENSHIWMSVENAIIQVENICNGLCEAFPEYESEFRGNTNEYVARLKALQKEIFIAGKGLEGKSFISFHDAYVYLARDLGFNILTTVESNEGGEPSAKKLAHLSDEIRQSDVVALVVEENYTGSAATILAAETNVKICVLNPVLRGEKDKGAYEAIMRENINRVEKAVENAALTQGR
jgi:zinc transport system substrate-binding protein